ncbi:MAG: cytochrome b5 domain-containing protein [Clostridiaceae bacterium]
MEKERILKKIDFYKYMSLNSLCPVQESYYEDLINMEEENLKRLDTQFTLEDLAKYNGSRGEKAYAAVDGIVYDMSNIAAWGGGTHFGNTAGKDLTGEFNTCHKKDVLVNIPKVGTLIK